MSTHILTDLLRGRGAHADPVSCFEALPLELAGQRVAAVEHTVWQQLVHLNYWMDYEIRSMTGPEVPYPEHASASWTEGDAPPDERSWEAERRRFSAQLDTLRAMALAEESALSRMVHPAKGETARDVLWQLVAHNSYHIGQVALLRRALGAWPPPAGGDSW